MVYQGKQEASNRCLALLGGGGLEASLACYGRGCKAGGREGGGGTWKKEKKMLRGA